MLFVYFSNSIVWFRKIIQLIKKKFSFLGTFGEELIVNLYTIYCYEDKKKLDMVI
jgi:hypothetical protein